MLTASNAKSIVEAMLARAWACRDKLTLHLPPERLALEPGSEVSVELTPSRWSVQKTVIDGLAVVADLRPAYSPAASVVAEAGRIVAPVDVIEGELTLALFDVPNVFEQSSTQPTLLLAATNPTRGWRRRPVELSYGGQSLLIETARRKSVLGRALTALATGEPYLLDNQNTLDVELIDPDQWLTSCDDEALATGANLAALGRELIQFGEAIALGSGQFRLGRLLRGRGGTEWASATHSTGEFICMIERASMQPLSLPDWCSGATITAADINGASAASTALEMNSVRPPAPVLVSAVFDGNGGLSLSWTRRSRRGWAWVDEVDAPLGETSELYRVQLRGAAGAAEFESEQTSLTVSATDLATLGSGAAVVEVRQVGDRAASRPATTTILLP